MRRMLVVIAAMTLSISACSKQATTDSGSTGQGAPVTLEGEVNMHDLKDLRESGDTAELELEIDNFYFNPTFVQTAPGAEVTVDLKNEGSATHTFTIDGLKIDQEMQPDATAKVTLTLPGSGIINFYCRFHRGRGMQGAFYFQPGGASTTPPSISPPPVDTTAPGY